jgi:uncharacterized MAPEG superfamily protein
MTIAYWCVLVAGLIPYGFVVYAKMTSVFFEGNHNRAPREYEEGLVGARKRAYWAHLNGFESFPLFAAAVIISHLAGAEQAKIDMLSIAFVLLRLLHGMVYIADWDKLRTLVWSTAAACVVGLFVVAA